MTSVSVHVPAQAEMDAERTADDGLSPAVCAQFGRAAVEVGSPDFTETDIREAAVDAIANVMHFLDREGLDIDSVLGSAEMHHGAEAVCPPRV